MTLPDEAGDVDVDEGGHEVLAVEPVHDAAVTRDGVGKILKRVKKRGGKFPGGQAGAAARRTGPSGAVTFAHLDLEGSLEAAGKEAAKGPHDGGEGGESDAVDLEGVESHRALRRRSRRSRRGRRSRRSRRRGGL